MMQLFARKNNAVKAVCKCKSVYSLKSSNRLPCSNTEQSKARTKIELILQKSKLMIFLNFIQDQLQETHKNRLKTVIYYITTQMSHKINLDDLI